MESKDILFAIIGIVQFAALVLVVYFATKKNK